MPTLILESKNSPALNAVKEVARELKINITEADNVMDETSLPDKSHIEKAKRKLNVKEIAGSIPNLNMDPKTFRKEIWERKRK